MREDPHGAAQCGCCLWYLRAWGCSFMRGSLGLGRKTHSPAHTHIHACMCTLILTARSCFRFFF